MEAAMWDDLHNRSILEPETFWGDAAKEVLWREPYSCVLTADDPVGKWFAGGVLNSCENAVDRHVVEDQRAIGTPFVG